MDRHTIYLAGGCFWGTEKYISQIAGVIDTTVGYANGNTENPSYEDVCAKSGHAETVKTVFDASVLPLEFLLKVFYRAIDLLSVNRQGGDVGIQYRTGVYYTDEADREIIEKSLDELSRELGERTAVECRRLEDFYEAEEYHQNYLVKNPDGYCHLKDGDFVCAAKAVPPVPALDKVKNIFNLRDLGGYACHIDRKVKYTSYGVFWRSDSTSRLTEEECRLLYNSGLRTVIDLRSEHEIKNSPSPLSSFEGIDYRVVSMLDNINSAVSASEIPDDLGEMYCMSLEGGGERTRELIDILAESEGTVLFNCTAGKDRTGVTAMILLDLAGVSRGDIIDNYAETEKRIKPLYEFQVSQLAKLGAAVPEKLLHADRENAEKFIDFLHEKYGGAREYLKSKSVSDEKIEKILDKFVY